MELRELRSFWTAARIQSISKAAEQLGIAQPTVTAQIHKLEEELGVLLFDRVKRPIELTSAGIKLAELVPLVFTEMDNIVAQLSNTEAKGPVRVASTHDIIPRALIRVVKAFVSSYPHVDLRIHSGTSREVLGMVRYGEVDVGIVPGPERRTDLDFQGICAYERVLITPLGHPLLQSPLESIDLIAQWPLILMGQGTSTRTMLEEEFRRRGLSYEIVVEMDSLDNIKEYVALGMGISVGPRFAVDTKDRNRLGIIGLGALLPVEQVGIVSLRDKAKSVLVQNFISVMKTIFGPASSGLY